VSISRIFIRYPNEKVLTTGRLMFPHTGLNDIVFDGAASTQLVIICDGAASSALLIQEGVG